MCMQEQAEKGAAGGYIDRHIKNAKLEGRHNSLLAGQRHVTCRQLMKGKYEDPDLKRGGVGRVAKRTCMQLRKRAACSSGKFDQ